MKIFRGAAWVKGLFKHPIITLGNFDGVHSGHLEIFNKVLARAAETNGEGIVFTFRPHPLKILSPDFSPPMLTTFNKKMKLISEANIKFLICARFSKKFADQHPRSFAKDILVNKIGAKEIIVGYDYKFGKGREGTIDYLRKMGKEYGFTVNVIEPFTINGEVVASTAIRDLLEEGKVKEVWKKLGRPYSIEGRVVNGMKKGSLIGYPTANIATPSELIPHTGVYAVNIIIEEKQYNGVANVGFNPTFRRDRLTVETHIFDFNNNLYGKKMEIYFIQRIREELEFTSAGALIVQIKKDIKTAMDILTRTSRKSQITNTK